MAELSAVMEGKFEDDFIDPFTGEPFVFKAAGEDEGEEESGVEGSGERFIIYTLGSNEKDDGGRTSMITRMIMDDDDDWPWKEYIIK